MFRHRSVPFRVLVTTKLLYAVVGEPQTKTSGSVAQFIPNPGNKMILYFSVQQVLFIVLPFCLCLSLRPHSHCGECERGDGRGGELVDGGEMAWCPILQATGDQSTVVH